MEYERIVHPEIHEVRAYSTKDETAIAFARDAIIKEVRTYPSIAKTNATGESMLPVYAELRRATDAGEVSFEYVLEHHLDEYYPYSRFKEHSFVRILYKELFIPLHIREKNIFTLNGLAANPHDEARRYDDLLTKHKIGLSVLGVGPGGHIGFNEAETSFESRTHLQVLSDETYLRDTVDRGQDTPKTALTQGISTILEADRIVMVAYGKYKGRILREALFGDITTACPASALRLVGSKVSIFVDKEAADEITLSR